MNTDYLAQARQNAITGMNTQNRPSIKKRYENQRIAEQAKINALRQSSMLEFDNQLEQLPQQYTAASNRAAVNAAMRKKAIQESMANMGLSAAGGTSRTTQLQRANNLNTNLANIGLAKQNAINDLNTQRRQANVGYDADEIAMNAKVNAAMNADLLAYDQWLQNYELSQRAAELSEKQLEHSQQQAKIDRYMNLFMNGRITAAQFKQATGITANEAVKKTGGGWKPPSNEELEKNYYNIQTPTSSPANKYGKKPNTKAGDYARNRGLDDIVMGYGAL